MEKLRDLKLNELHLMASASGSGSGKCTCVGDQICDICRGDVDPIEIWGSGSGSGNSAATCRRCGTPYDSWGMCPNCDSNSGSGSGSGSGLGSGSGSGSGSGNNESGPNPEPLPYGQCFIGSIMKALMILGARNVDYAHITRELIEFSYIAEGGILAHKFKNDSEIKTALEKFFYVEKELDMDKLKVLVEQKKYPLIVQIDKKYNGNTNVDHSITVYKVDTYNYSFRYYDPTDAKDGKNVDMNKTKSWYVLTGIK